MDQKKRKRVAEKIKELMEDYHPNRTNENKDRDVLYDDFASELAVALAPIGSQNLRTDRVRDMVKNQALRGMYKTDDKDEYYDYKNRFKGADSIATRCMHLIQRGEEFQHGGGPKFTKYSNVSDEMRISESTDDLDENEIRSYVRSILSEFSMGDMSKKKQQLKQKNN